MVEGLLPSWRDGAARTAVVDFLDAVLDVAPEQRVAAFDNDGTLWCERPTYPQQVSAGRRSPQPGGQARAAGLLARR